MNGNLISELKSDQFQATYGYPIGLYHRVDLHSELKLLATSPDVGKSKPAELRTKVRITDVVSIPLEEILQEERS